MGNLHSMKEKFTKFLSTKGFYVALSLCLVGASAAAWVAVDRTLTGIRDNNDLIVNDEKNQVEAPQWDFPVESSSDTAEVQTQVPSKPSSPSSTSSSSSQASSQSAAAAEQPAISSNVQTPVYVLPLIGEIFNPYSGTELVKNETLGEWRTHDGIDIKADLGSAVQAVADGTVTAIKNDPLWGTTIEIEHANNLVSIYCGLNKDDLKVAIGDNVKMEQQIGTVGEILAEISSPSHLHFAMKQNGELVDPLVAMGKK